MTFKCRLFHALLHNASPCVIVLVFILLLSSCRFSIGTCYGTHDCDLYVSHAQRAQRLREDGQLLEAIKEYESHVQTRLRDTRRPEGENPYFYYLLIGDVYLDLDDIAAAENAFQTAKAQDVDPLLVRDKLRMLGKWYEEKGDYENAIEVLKRYRELDPLMFDADIDRNHKSLVREAQEREEKQSPH